MVEVEERLREELERIAPLSDAARDWQDVLARARASGAPGEAPIATRRRRVVVFALAAFLLAAGAAIAVDLIGRKNVLFGSSKPAPNVVKKSFADLAMGAPPQMQPGVLAGQAREVGTFTIHGHRRRLWVAPTRRGGYCYTFERAFSGCRRDSRDRTTASLGVTWMEATPWQTIPIVAQIGGDITDPAASQLTIEYADGTSRDISFVWVSKPISAGFFAYDIPRAHQQPATRVEKIVLRSRSGKRLGVQEFKPRRIIRPNLPRPARRPGTRKPHVLPSQPSAPPSAPLQRGSAKGVTVKAGRNGSVVFNLARLDPKLRPLLTRGIGYTCYRLTREFGIFTVRSGSYSGALAATVGLQYQGIGTPFDGCELQGQYGHRWPDRFSSHSAVEIPLTAKGRAFVADRAAARDLALFVRSQQMHRLRKLQGQKLTDALQATFGAQLAHSRIRYQTSADGATFSEQSTTRKTFTLVIRNGRIAHQNLKPYALAF